MSPEINAFEQPISSLGNLTQAKELHKENKVNRQLNNKNKKEFQNEIAWQKELESENPEFMKDIKIGLIPKLEKVINHLQEILDNPDSEDKVKFDSQEELERRIIQRDRLIEKYKNND